MREVSGRCISHPEVGVDVWVGVVQVGLDSLELGAVTAVEDEVESMVCKCPAIGFTDAVGGAGYQCPGIRSLEASNRVGL